jgi:hypothetical protein
MPGPKLLAGPAYIAASAANIYNPASGLVGLIRQIHVANVTAAPVTFTLYVGATAGSAGGTELEKAYSVAANGDWDRFFADMPLMSSQFLTGLASAGSSLVITVIGEEESA